MNFQDKKRQDETFICFYTCILVDDYCLCGLPTCILLIHFYISVNDCCVCVLPTYILKFRIKYDEFDIHMIASP